MIFASALAIAFATYAVPFLGFPLSLGLPVLTYRVRRFLWPSVTDRASRVCSVLAWVGLWLPALVDFFTPWFYANGMAVSTSWLLIPLAGPDSIDAVLMPALAATGVIMLGLLLSAVIRRPWPWVLAAWLAPWVHQFMLSLIPHTFIA